MSVGPSTQNMHATVVAAGEAGLLILGESGAGKSMLAARMIAEWPFGKVRLVADDRALLSLKAQRVVARAHAAIAGSLELRGQGIVRPPILEAVVIRAVLRLSEAFPPRLPTRFEQHFDLLGISLPFAMLPTGDAAFERIIAIWPYLRVDMGVE